MRSNSGRRVAAGGFVAGAIVLAVASVAAACTSYVGKLTVAANGTSHTVEGSGDNGLHRYCVNNQSVEGAPVGTVQINGAFTLQVTPGTSPSGSTDPCNTEVKQLPAETYEVRWMPYDNPSTTVDSNTSWCNKNPNTLSQLGTITVNGNGYSVDASGAPAAKQFALPPYHGKAAFCVVNVNLTSDPNDPTRTNDYSAPELRTQVNLI